MQFRSRAVQLSHFYEFAEFRIDLQQRLLFRNVFETLLVLVENHGQVVEKETILKRVWADTFVEEGSLTRNISVLRKALESRFPGEECVETIPKRGYRFVARLNAAPARVVDETSELKSPGLRTRNHDLYLALVACCRKLPTPLQGLKEASSRSYPAARSRAWDIIKPSE